MDSQEPDPIDTTRVTREELRSFVERFERLEEQTLRLQPLGLDVRAVIRGGLSDVSLGFFMPGGPLKMRQAGGAGNHPLEIAGGCLVVFLPQGLLAFVEPAVEVLVKDALGQPFHLVHQAGIAGQPGDEAALLDRVVIRVALLQGVEKKQSDRLDLFAAFLLHAFVFGLFSGALEKERGFHVLLLLFEGVCLVEVSGVGLQLDDLQNAGGGDRGLAGLQVDHREFGVGFFLDNPAGERAAVLQVDSLEGRRR